MLTHAGASTAHAPARVAVNAAACWPSLEQELLLRAAALDSPYAIEAWTAWQAAVDIENLDPGSFRLLPLLQRNLTRLGVTGPLMQRLRGVHRQAWFRNTVLFGRTADVVRALADAGIDTLLLKGIPLALRYYREESTRPMADADVLVRENDAAAAVECLQRHGWASQQPLPRWPPPHRGSWAFRNDAGHELDLHWHVFADCLGAHDDDDLWEASVPLLVSGAATRALAPADQLLHVLAHGIHWNPLPSIRWVADAAAIVSASESALDWDRLLAQAKRRQLTMVVAAGLPYIRELLGVPVPDAVLTALAARPAGAAEWFALWARTTGGAVPGAWRMWNGYARSLAGTGRWPTPIGFVDYLREAWLVDSGWEIPAVVREKLARAGATRT
jgi:hypothetical protein